MTDDLKAPERIWVSAPDSDNEVQCWCDPDEGGTEYIRADRIATLEAALADMTQQRDAAMAGAVKVRELVWEEEPRNGWKIGVSYATGYYLIRHDDGWHYGNHEGGIFATIEDAKAAAQADYEARILSALTPDPDRLLALTAAAEAQAEVRGMRRAAEIAEETGTRLMPNGHFLSEWCRDAILSAADATEAAAKGGV